MASDTGGVKPMPIEGRLARERERLLCMSEADRQWRKKWLKDQELAPNEPKVVPELQKELMNPIRRLYRFPLDTAFRALEPVMGPHRAQVARYATGKILMSIFGMFAVAYYFKYNTNDWTKKGGWRVLANRKSVLPGDERFPLESDRVLPSDYASRGFKNSPI